MTSDRETEGTDRKRSSDGRNPNDTARANLGGLASTLETYIKAGYPILYVVTPEEERALDIICEMLERSSLKRTPYFWSVSRGLCAMDYKPVNPGKRAEPTQILPFLEQFEEPGVFILEDFHFFLDERSKGAPVIIRHCLLYTSPSPRDS